MSGTNYFTPTKNQFVKIALTNENNEAEFASCVGNPNTVAIEAGIYSNGCFMRQTDLLSGPAMWQNEGTIDVPSWSLLASGGSSPSFAYNETPTGTVNSINTIFTLAHSPSPAGSLQLYLNGQLQYQGVDYTLSAATITFAVAPFTGVILLAFYQY